MEFIQTFAAFFVAIAVAAAVLQVVFAYALQVIVEKNEMSNSTAFMSWIPVLNIYPFIKAGGGNFMTFILGTVGAGIAVALVIRGAAEAGLAELGSSIAAAVFVVLAVAYFASITMETAERRGLSKWLGLVLFVPIAGFVVYPYIAFHDGFHPPKKLGLILGLLLAFGPLPGQIEMVEQMSGQAQEIAQIDRGDGVTVEEAIQGLRATREVGLQVAMIAGLDPSNAGQRSKMIDALESAQTKLDMHAKAIGDEIYQKLNGLLATQQDRLERSSVDTQNASADDADPFAKADSRIPSGVRLAEGVPSRR